MGDIVALGLPATGNGPEPHERLRTCSRLLAGIVTIVLCGVLVFTSAVLVLGFAFDGAFISIGPSSAYLGAPPELPGIVPFGSLPLPTRLAYAATLIMNTVPVLLVLAHLGSLLRFYASGVVFGTESGRRIKRVAFWLVAYAVAPFLGHQLVVLAGHGVDTAWFHASEVQALILGGVLFVVAEVMEIGRGIEQDRDGFV